MEILKKNNIHFTTDISIFTLGNEKKIIATKNLKCSIEPIKWTSSQKVRLHQTAVLKCPEKVGKSG